MAEWLGKGLQNLIQRFESASDLTKTALQMPATRFSFCFVIHLSYAEDGMHEQCKKIRKKEPSNFGSFDF